MRFGQEHHALNVVCAAEHIDCYALVGGVAEGGETGAVTGGGGCVNAVSVRLRRHRHR